jgi:N6-L-threonylcarbamoyladenine synthase
MIALAGALHPEMAQSASAEFPVRARWSLVKEEA